MLRIHNTLSKPANSIRADRFYLADTFDVLPQCENNSFDLEAIWRIGIA
jgi:hypothetical protein